MGLRYVGPVGYATTGYRKRWTSMDWISDTNLQRNWWKERRLTVVQPATKQTQWFVRRSKLRSFPMRMLLYEGPPSHQDSHIPCSERTPSIWEEMISWHILSHHHLFQHEVQQKLVIAVLQWLGLWWLSAQQNLTTRRSTCVWECGKENELLKENFKFLNILAQHHA